MIMTGWDCKSRRPLILELPSVITLEAMVMSGGCAVVGGGGGGDIIFSLTLVVAAAAAGKSARATIGFFFLEEVELPIWPRRQEDEGG